MQSDSAHSGLAFGRGDSPGGWRLIAGGFLCLLVVAVAALQASDKLQPNAPAYVQRFLLSEIPAGTAPHFSISDLTGANASEGLAGEDGAAENADGSDGQQQLAQQIASSDSGENAIVLAGGQRVLDIDYDLNVDGLRPGDLEVGKVVSLNGRRVGTINVSIDQNSQLHLSVADLSRVLPVDVYAQIRPEGDFVTFDALRNNGLDIRYDPVRDILQINS